MTPNDITKIGAEWIKAVKETEHPKPYNPSEPRIPKKYWVDENNIRVYPEEE